MGQIRRSKVGQTGWTNPLCRVGFSVVIAIWFSTPGNPLAIKTLPEEFATDEERLARFEREANLLATLNHPSIAAINGLKEDNATQLLVLEPVEDARWWIGRNRGFGVTAERQKW